MESFFNNNEVYKGIREVAFIDNIALLDGIEQGVILIFHILHCLKETP